MARQPAFRQNRAGNQFSTSLGYLGCMDTQPGHFRKAVRRIPRDDLLKIWLELLDHLDNPIRRKATKLRQAQRPRRDIPPRGFPGAFAGRHHSGLEAARRRSPNL